MARGVTVNAGLAYVAPSAILLRGRFTSPARLQISMARQGREEGEGFGRGAVQGDCAGNGGPGRRSGRRRLQEAAVEQSVSRSS